MVFLNRKKIGSLWILEHPELRRPEAEPVVVVEVGLPVDVGAVDEHAVVLVARLDGHLVAVATESGVDRVNAKNVKFYYAFLEFYSTD